MDEALTLIKEAFGLGASGPEIYQLAGECYQIKGMFEEVFSIPDPRVGSSLCLVPSHTPSHVLCVDPPLCHTERPPCAP